MENSWVVYGCELVDVAEVGIEDVGVEKAIRIHREDVKATAVGLPRGFTTKVLLDYDFSDDGQVVSFVGEYGPVMCPYGGAIERTFAAIEEPVAYRRLLYSISHGSDDEKEDDSPGFFARLFGRVRGRREVPGLIDESAVFGGCDAMWDGKKVFYMGLQGSPESEYARVERAGFLRYLEADDKLVGTERVRASAMNEAARKHQADGEWAYPDCLIALEEVRSVLYLLQVSAIVMQGLSFIDSSLDERRNAGIQRNRYRSALLPKVDVEECTEEDRRQASLAEDGAARVAGLQKDIRRIERLFGLFIEGRPNIIKAFKAVRDSCLVSMDRDPELLGRPDGIFSESEQGAIERRLEDAYASCGEDDETRALLGLRPLWRAWDGLINDVALFLNACLTSCWSVGGHRLIETPALRVGEYVDGGAYFAQGTGRMTLQRAIAEQVVSNLDFAYERLHQPAGPGKAELVWQICECCGLPYIFRSTSRKLVLEGAEGRQTRNKLPSATTCSDACRMRMTRSNG